MWSEKVKRMMEIKGINQKELAKLSGITEASVSRYLSSERTPRIDVIVNFARALNVTVDELLDSTVNNNSLYLNIERTILLAREGEKLSPEEQTRLIQLIVGFNNEKR